jgi:hypothetical protein
LAGTGDPNDALDSYYGAGILRSTDGGSTWSVTNTTADNLWGFAGEGIAGFAWSTVNPQLVIAAVSQAYEGTLVNLMLTITAGFELENNTCGLTLAPGSSCTAGVEFAPTSAGQQTGTLTVTSSVAGASIPLSGMGFDFTVTVSGSNTQTVASGQTASYTLLITPLNGSAGTFTFSCGTLPANAQCLFSSGTETLSAGITGNVTVEIETGGTGAAARLRAPMMWGVVPAGLLSLGLVPMACGLILLPVGWKRFRKVLTLAGLLLIFAGGISSCVSSGGGTATGKTSGGGGSTPTGTYTIPATAVSNGLQRSVNLTLTVD